MASHCSWYASEFFRESCFYSNAVTAFAEAGEAARAAFVDFGVASRRLLVRRRSGALVTTAAGGARDFFAFLRVLRRGFELKEVRCRGRSFTPSS